MSSSRALRRVPSTSIAFSVSARSFLSCATVAAMTADQLATQPAFAARPNRRKQGLAWILKGPGDAQYGDLTSEATYGHHGATCSLLWIDPVNAITFVFLGNREGSIAPHYFARLSNVVVGAVLE